MTVGRVIYCIHDSGDDEEEERERVTVCTRMHDEEEEKENVCVLDDVGEGMETVCVSADEEEEEKMVSVVCDDGGPSLPHHRHAGQPDKQEIALILLSTPKT